MPFVISYWRVCLLLKREGPYAVGLRKNGVNVPNFGASFFAEGIVYGKTVIGVAGYYDKMTFGGKITGPHNAYDRASGIKCQSKFFFDRGNFAGIYSEAFATYCHEIP